MNFPASIDQNVVEKNDMAFGPHVTCVKKADSLIDRNNHV
jgi:hypothetical protein